VACDVDRCGKDANHQMLKSDLNKPLRGYPHPKNGSFHCKVFAAQVQTANSIQWRTNVAQSARDILASSVATIALTHTHNPVIAATARKAWLTCIQCILEVVVDHICN
jgi:hypothetical protein